jgi:hypothetical protein
MDGRLVAGEKKPALRVSIKTVRILGENCGDITFWINTDGDEANVWNVY